MTGSADPQHITFVELLTSPLIRMKNNFRARSNAPMAFSVGRNDYRLCVDVSNILVCFHLCTIVWAINLFNYGSHKRKLFICLHYVVRRRETISFMGSAANTQQCNILRPVSRSPDIDANCKTHPRTLIAGMRKLRWDGSLNIEPEREIGEIVC